MRHAARSLPFKPDDQLLLYTDGVSEARDGDRKFYPLDERLALLGAQVRRARASGDGAALLDLIRDDLLRHAGAPLEDDAALLLIGAPAQWPGRTPAAAVPARSQAASFSATAERGDPITDVTATRLARSRMYGPPP